MRNKERCWEVANTKPWGIGIPVRLKDPEVYWGNPGNSEGSSFQPNNGKDEGKETGRIGEPSPAKTTYVLLKRNPRVNIDGQTIRRSKDTRYLGVVMDEKRDFMTHVENAYGKALRAMNKIINIGQGRFKQSMRLIRLLSGAYKTVATDALCVALGIWPLNLEVRRRAALYWIRKGDMEKVANLMRAGITTGLQGASPGGVEGGGGCTPPLGLSPIWGPLDPERGETPSEAGYRRCNIPGAYQLEDFLPLKCDACQMTFCKEHMVYSCHNCPSACQKDVQVPLCPLCNSPVLVGPGEQPDLVVGEHIDQDCQAIAAIDRRKIHSSDDVAWTPPADLEAIDGGCELNIIFTVSLFDLGGRFRFVFITIM
uniref:RING-type domain-containing protein n=1 Tax=Timema tahoe TaxID=61484 RepID=A0A7R9FE68_9NEOP|nr:unnamed protein product [Timema tahoe]